MARALKKVSTRANPYSTTRTRGADKALEKVEELKADESLINKVLRSTADQAPTKTLTGKRIFSGSSRSFEASFATAWWEKQPTPWTCAICKKEIDAKGVGSKKPSIDHKVAWAMMKLGIEEREVCKDGIHWTVVYADDARAVIQDENNLRPTHQGCNSKKSGSKKTDSIAPKKKGSCPGTECKAIKAK